MAKVKTKPPVKKDDLLIEVLYTYPKSMEIFSKYGLECMGCFGAHYETIEMGAKAHGMKTKDIVKMIEEINTNGKKK